MVVNCGSSSSIILEIFCCQDETERRLCCDEVLTGKGVFVWLINHATRKQSVLVQLEISQNIE